MVELTTDQDQDAELSRMPEEFVRCVLAARNLRRMSDAATADEFFYYLDFERREDVWKNGTGIATFAAVLTRFNLRSPERYETFKVAVARLGEDRVRLIGVDQCAEIVGIPEAVASIEDGERNAFAAVVEEVMASKERNGVSPSSRNVVSIRNKHWRKPAIEAKRDRDEELDELRSRCAKLEKEKGALIRRLDVAERKLARAEERWINRGDRSRGESADGSKGSRPAAGART